MSSSNARTGPLLRGQPIEIAAWKWLVMIVAAVAGFAALSTIPASSDLVLLGPRILFVAIPLITFIAVTGRYWRAIFRLRHGRDPSTIVAYWASSEEKDFWGRVHRLRFRMAGG